jgi:tetratricopeptide (TPR) repeat protein
MSSSRGSRFAAGLGLAILTIGAYARVAGNGFIDLDDQAYVNWNPMVQAGLTWRGVKWAFTTSHSANWHPLTWLSHMLDVQMYGMNAGGHHLTSLALHVASTLLLFHLFLRMTGAFYPSAFVAAVFGLHPLHVESVAWVAERKDLLSAFFWILTTLAYVSWTEKRGTARYLAVLALFALGLMSKPMLVTLPFTLLLLDVWPLKRADASLRGIAALVREKIPLFLLAAASSAVTFLVQRGYGAMRLGDRVPFGLRAENAIVATATYLGKAIAPARLAVFYPYPTQAYPAWQVLGTALLLAAATVFALRERRSCPWLAVGWLWFLGTLVPVIGLVQVGPQALADRYTYVPMIGLSAAVAFGAAELARRSDAARYASASILLVAVAAWTGLTWRQVGLWKDDRTLFGRMVEIMPETHLGYGVLGNVNLFEGRYDEAIVYYRRALALQPNYALWSSNLGRAFLLTGRIPEAKAAFEAALHDSPDLAAAHQNLGYILGTLGDLDGAIEHYEAALRSDPDLHETHYNLGGTLLQKGRIDEAIAHFERALEIAPDYAPARTLLNAARAARNRTPPR